MIDYFEFIADDVVENILIYVYIYTFLSIAVGYIPRHRISKLKGVHL